MSGTIQSERIGASETAPPSRMSDEEREEHVRKLRAILDKERLTREDGLVGMRHCALLTHDDFYSLPMDVGLEPLSRLFKAAIGKAPGSYKSNTTIEVADEPLPATAYEVWYLRGVLIRLSVDGEIVSLTVYPQKMRRIKEMMKYVGSIKGGPTDMSINHDSYWDAEWD